MYELSELETFFYGKQSLPRKKKCSLVQFSPHSNSFFTASFRLAIVHFCTSNPVFGIGSSVLLKVFILEVSDITVPLDVNTLRFISSYRSGNMFLKLGSHSYFFPIYYLLKKLSYYNMNVI